MRHKEREVLGHVAFGLTILLLIGFASLILRGPGEVVIATVPPTTTTLPGG